RARAKVTADENGEFIFVDVKFSASVLESSFEDLAPKEVPSGLQKYSIFPIQKVAEQQKFPYYIFIIAEDKAGKTGYWQKNVNVNSCYSANFDFSVESVSKFQAPLRLVPQLMDDGRQEIQAVFKLDYLGEGLPKMVNGEEVEKGARIVNVRFEKACTKEMSEDEKFGLGCKILPSTERQQTKSNDDSAVYATWKLHSSTELSEKKEDFWNEFKKRQVVFPLKITVQYQEREGENKWSQTKFQTSCYDLSYFVDIPVESKNMIPDFLANEGVDALDKTIETIQTVRPYLEKAFLITGISCMASFLIRLVARWSRELTSRLETYYTFVKLGKKRGDPGGCPLPIDQGKLYMKDTIDNWKKLPQDKIPTALAEVINDEEKVKEFTLEERCPQTAGAWKFEAAINKAYQWSCDRAFCRSVPAGWTEDKTELEIGEVILKQQQCAVTGRGVPLMKKENCQKLVAVNPTAVDPVVQKDNPAECWQTTDGKLYYYSGRFRVPQEEKDTRQGVYRLDYVSNVLGKLEASPGRLLVYKPDGAEDYVVGKDQSCKDVCNNPRKGDYGYDTAGSVDGKGCYNEKPDTDGEIKLFGKEGILGEKKEGEDQKPPNKYAAGYTSDCFIKRTGTDNTGDIAYENGEPVFQQCVCVGKKEDQGKYQNADLTKRTAIPKDGEIEEEWFYRQERVFKESKNTIGTYYPPERYISGRDLSGAFGQDHLLDYFRAEDNKEIATINPHSQFIGMFQSLCLSAILKNLRMLESILVGLRNCLVEAKYTGLQDAGMCKTLFTQHVCGLIYKAIAYMTSGCHATNFDDAGKGGAFGDIGVIFSEGFDSMDSAVESSIDDLKDDYGNAALNQYFKGGTQGFAQSLCLAAFGYEFPLFSDEFLLDAAYAVPMKTSVVLAPKERELSTYNPAKQTAIYNYNIGGVILPGCRIKSWKVSLKCIGPEDYGKPGVDISCNGKGCDCINAQSQSSPLEAEKTKQLMTGFDLASGQMFSIPLPSPQKVDSHYRYDHVVIELMLDQSEKGNEDKCFDEGYHEGMKGIFYEPIIDTSPPAELTCHADLVSGRYLCPELATMFGFGGAYLEEPYVSCWNKRTSSWTSDCTTPNLFVLNDEIKIKPHLNLDDKGKCLKRTVSPVVPGISAVSGPRTLPEGIPGPFYPEETLGIVNENMFGAGVNSIQLLQSASSNKCQGLAQLTSPTTVVSTTQQYSFRMDAGGLLLPAGASIESTGYSRNGAYLSKGNVNVNDIDEINKVQFNVGGFKVSNVLAGISAVDEQKVCTYQVIPAGTGSAQKVDTRNIQVTYELLERDEGGTCAFATIPVKTTTGKARWTQQIRIQRAETAFQQVSGMHQAFMSGNWDQVHNTAIEILNQKKNDLSSAIALYYEVSALIMKGNGFDLFGSQINNLLKTFFERDYGGSKIDDYSAEAIGTSEFKKVKKYLCEVDKKMGGVYQGKCGSGTTTTTINYCLSEKYPINTLMGGDALYAYSCTNSTYALSCVKATGKPPLSVTQPFEIPTGHPLKELCKSK
ncbi:MAG: hypothetical protein KKD75_01350, partial [Nanoarchaeota archaeon]|nr:hypothetical protein [Nanoarchaeota archaeon]